MSKQHDVKCWTPYFEQVERGELPVQIRENDRNYQSGDILNLQEFEPSQVDAEMKFDHPDGRYTGRERKQVINRVIQNLPGLKPDFVLLTVRAHIER